jgi:excisionase family DNA binding protein
MNADLPAAAETAGTPGGHALLGEPLVDAAAVAAHLGVDKATIYRLAAATELPAIDVAPRVVRFRPSDVRAFLERRTRKAAPRGRVKRLLGNSPSFVDEPCPN